MNPLCISTRGICSWRERLANPELHWKPGYSAFEAAVSWELASRRRPTLPGPIHKLFRESEYGESSLLLAIAEHQVDLLGQGHAAQCDVWAVVKTSSGLVSMSVEAKAGEPFGDEILEHWLISGDSEKAHRNRKKRWDYIRVQLPESDSFLSVRYQLLQRCAAAVIEARRFGFQHAAFVVQAFQTPDRSFQDYSNFCQALKIPAKRGIMSRTTVDGITLAVGWADCPIATEAQRAAATKIRIQSR